MIRVGLAGGGFMGKMHAEIYRHLPGAQLAVVADALPEAAQGLAERHGAKAVSSWQKLVRRKDVDLVDVCLPTFLHKQAAVAAARAGKHVLCEKPMALSARETKAMIAAAEKAGVTLMVAQCLRFWPEYVALKEYLDSGRLGRLLSFNCSRISPMPTWSAGNWMGDASKSGGAGLDLHIHDADMILYLLGRPQSVYSRASWEAGGAAHIFTLYQYPEVAVSASGGWNLPGNFPFSATFQAVFEGGALSYNSGASPTLMAYPREAAPHAPELKHAPVQELDVGGNLTNPDGYYQELEYLVGCLERGGKPSVVTPQEAAQSVEVVLAELKSARRGRPVRL